MITIFQSVRKRIETKIQNYLFRLFASALTEDSVRYITMNPDQVIMVVTSSEELFDSFSYIAEDPNGVLQGKNIYVVLDREPGKTEIILKYED